MSLFYFFLIVWWKKNFKSNCFIICFKPFLVFWQLGKFISFQPYLLIKGSIFDIGCVKNFLIRSYSGRHFSRIFPHGLNTVHLSVFSPNAGECGKNADKNNSEYGLFLRSDSLQIYFSLFMV